MDLSTNLRDNADSEADVADELQRGPPRNAEFKTARENGRL